MKASDFFELSETEIKNTKVHFATGDGNNEEALTEFLKAGFKDWQEWQGLKNFSRKYILSLIYINPNEWLFGGVYEVLGYEQKEDGKGSHYKYSTRLTNKGKDWIGRLIIRYQKKFRISYAFCEKYISDFEIIELRRNRYETIDFPGYENVSIDFDDLRLIIETGNISWKSALSNVQGIYLITDNQNGKLYVGSAYGEDNFWQRCREYIKTGHGYNKELIKLKAENNEEYFNNLTFSILEIFKNTTDADEILKRESYWKKILASREYGYNSN
ncbi:MAG TPA: GIY-YIG nuclease family protein [Clostridia bacterium]|nr:GIY-YIG nuclease family protein [Clostridia bacterium]